MTALGQRSTWLIWDADNCSVALVSHIILRVVAWRHGGVGAYSCTLLLMSVNAIACF